MKITEKRPQNIFTLNICLTNCFDSSSSFRQVVELHRFPAIKVPVKINTHTFVIRLRIFGTAYCRKVMLNTDAIALIAGSFRVSLFIDLGFP